MCLTARAVDAALWAAADGSSLGAFLSFSPTVTAAVDRSYRSVHNDYMLWHNIYGLLS